MTTPNNNERIDKTADSLKNNKHADSVADHNASERVENVKNRTTEHVSRTERTEHVHRTENTHPEEHGSYAPKKKKKIWPWLLALLLLLLLIIGGCAALGGNKDDDKVNVELSATTTGDAAVNHHPGGAEAADNAFTDSWTTTVNDINVKDGYSMAVTDKDGSAANLGCKITVDGVVQDEQTAAEGENKVVCNLPDELKK
ncbi:hypothetical protein ACIP5Z_03140 [Rothia terrae]|uniref:hypothetical protein n=1 Tax=Rothia terrae TaxID=396015 RepID=UPI003800D63E